MIIRVVGVDGGGTTGLALLILEKTDPAQKFHTVKETTFYQFEGASADTVRGNIEALHPDIIAVEDFVSMRRAGRLAGYRKGGKLAADIAAVVAAMRPPGTPGRQDGKTYYPITRNSAGRAKKWGSDRRLAAAGIRPRGMVHAMDAARHALFTACNLGLVEDPLMVQQRAAQRRRTPKGPAADVTILDETVAMDADGFFPLPPTHPRGQHGLQDQLYQETLLQETTVIPTVDGAVDNLPPGASVHTWLEQANAGPGHEYTDMVAEMAARVREGLATEVQDSYAMNTGGKHRLAEPEHRDVWTAPVSGWYEVGSESPPRLIEEQG